MFCVLQSVGLLGLTCQPVAVEVDLHKGQTNFAIVGLADTSIKEAKDRIYSAIKNAGFQYPFNFRILVNLAPADTHKEGAAYDLPMALGIVAMSTGRTLRLGDALVAGELALDGSVRHIPGVVSIALHAKQQGIAELFIPAVDAWEASLVADVTIYPVRHLAELWAHVTGRQKIARYVRTIEPEEMTPIDDSYDFALIKGQSFAKRALEIAASGGHNILLSGPPGSGKTLLARTLPTILPSLSTMERLEVTRVHSVAGLLQQTQPSVRPFRSPHHTASSVALVGGGRTPRPGEISLAHRGVLFLDEFPEFSRYVIESLRQPLEDGVVTIARAEGTVTFPARFMLVASQNPCPCGYASDPARPCVCSPHHVIQYKKKISGPLLDRIDMQIEVPRVPFDKLTAVEAAESSAQIRERVLMARARQHERFVDSTIETNSEMGPREINKFCELDPETLLFLRAAVQRWQLSARVFNRLLRLSRTIADLAEAENITLTHVSEALQFRTIER